jgi:putative endonuclease
MTKDRNVSMATNSWYTYIVKCADNTLYTGVTTDIERRIDEHNTKKTGAKYTRTRQPVILVYSEKHPDRSSASSREYEIKNLPRSKKLKLIHSPNRNA